MKAVWVVRDTLGSKQRLLTLIETVQQYGFTDLIVQVRGRGQAYYRSQIDPPAPYDEAVADPLAFLLERLTKTGIKVHAWINTLLTWSDKHIPPGHVFESQPHWSIVSREGKSALAELQAGMLNQKLVEGAYLCPSRPEVVDYLTRVYTEVAANYPVAGIHLDYVRLPSSDYCYCSVCRAEAASAADHADYLQKTMTDLTRTLSQACKKVRPDIVFSAAVVPDAHRAKTDNAQDWAQWTAAGIVDLLFPMAYHADPTATASLLQKATQQSHVPVVAGLGAYLQSHAAMQQTLTLVKPLTLAGVCYFSYTTFEKDASYLPAIT